VARRYRAAVRTLAANPAVHPSVHPERPASGPPRHCARPDCSAVAAVTLVCDYSARTVVISPASDAPEVDDPARYDLCARHASRFRPPHGWELTVDAVEPEPEPAPAPARTAHPARVRETHAPADWRSGHVSPAWR
jgi:hypothetical protein